MRLVAIAALAACGVSNAPRNAPPSIAASPPPSVCTDPTTLRTYDLVGGRVMFTDQICTAGCTANACNVAHPCSPQPVVMTNVGALEAPVLAAERDHLYVAGHRRVIRWNARTGVVDVISDTGGRALAVDSSHVYWVAGLSGNEITRAPRDGGPATSIVGDREHIVSLAVDDSHIYWSELDVNNTSHNGIWRISKQGGVVEAFAPNQRGATGVALDATHVYWTDQFERRVMRKLKAGGPIELLATTQDSATWIALDDQFVYWVAGDAIGRVPKRGGATDIVQTSGATGLAVTSGGDLFWTTDSEVWSRVAGASKRLIHGNQHTFAAAVGPQHVYWVTSYPERVMRAPLNCE